MMTDTSAFWEQVNGQLRADIPDFDRRVAEANAQMDIGQQLYDLREAASLTQEQLAEKAGLTADDIDALELGDWQGTTLDQLQRAVTALGSRVEIQFTTPEPVAA